MLPKTVYTVAEVAEMLGMCLVTTYRAIEDNQIPHKRVRGRIIIPVAMFDAWMAQPEREVAA